MGEAYITRHGNGLKTTRMVAERMAADNRLRARQFGSAGS
jgi:hypothetical protein